MFVFVPDLKSDGLNAGGALTHRSPHSRPPRPQGRARVQMTRHVALGRSPGAVGQGLMAVLVVFALSVHLAAGDEAPAVALAAAGRALEGRINQGREKARPWPRQGAGMLPFIFGRPPHLGPVPRDPDHLAGVAVAALHVRGSDQVGAVHLVELPAVVVLAVQGPLPVAPPARPAAL